MKIFIINNAKLAQVVKAREEGLNRKLTRREKKQIQKLDTGQYLEYVGAKKFGRI